MAHTASTGSAMTASFGATLAAYPGIKRITISEAAPPLPEMLDNTKATDSAYSTTADPLGGKGTPKTTITIEGLASLSDFGDSGVLADALNTVGTAIVKPFGATATYNLFTLLLAGFTDYTRSDDIRELATYTARLEVNAVGAWTAN